MAKKYLSIEEAASQLEVSATELNRLREKGLIRAFADRGTWKFKEEDVEKLMRSREADSNPDVPLHQAPSASSSSEMVTDDDDVLADQPTIISKSPGEDSSDSDVRLIFDDAMKVDESGETPRLSDSDSDVKLAGPPAGASADDSDSDVKLAGSKQGILDAGSDSDVKLVMDDVPTKDTSGSDSDVRLVSSDSSGEVKLAGSSGSIPIAATDDSSVVGDETGGGSSIVEGDSGISLGEGSGIALASDSGISLERPNDSGISLSEESSLVLGEDSGISLAGDASLKSESGISLAGQPASDRTKKKSAKAKPHPDAEDLSGTVPLMDVPLSEDEDLLDTHMEVPSLDDSQASDDLFGDEGETANVVTLDDDEEGYDVTANIPTHGGAALDDSEEEVVAGDDEEPVEVADDLLGEDDELAEDVFGAEDDDFADEVESGESHSELPVSPRGMVAVAEQDWGPAMHSLLIASTISAVVCGTVLFDMVRNMWHTDAANHNPIASALLDMFKNI
jgi:excisionase family DNA binding protein